MKFHSVAGGFNGRVAGRIKTFCGRCSSTRASRDRDGFEKGPGSMRSPGPLTSVSAQLHEVGTVMQPGETKPDPLSARSNGQPTRYKPGQGNEQEPTTPEVQLWEPHFTVQQLAKQLHVHPATIRRNFHDEPGVLHLGTPKSNRRTYDPIRIPRSVALRVYRRLTGA